MRWSGGVVAAVLCMAVAGCSGDGKDEGAAPAGDAQVSVDAAGLDARAPDAETADAAGPDARAPDAADAPDALPPDAAPPDAAPGPAFGRRPLPTPAAQLRAPRDWRFARGLIHMHSAHSHDACDGRPRIDGQVNAPCLDRLRTAICEVGLDYLLLTDHPTHLDEIPFLDALLHREGDRLERDGEAPIANRVVCPGGHEVLVSAGSEGDLVPVMLRRHPDDLGAYRSTSPEAAERLRLAGGFLLQAHTERFTADEVLAMGVDGVEIYNLHANLAPNGELQQLPQFLRLLSALAGAGARGTHPDLWFLGILRENPLALTAWDGVTPHRRMLGTAGSDIHENTALVRPADGDRIDSYRRLSSWFANYLLVRRVDYAGVRDALEGGRLFVAFDLLGAPDGFDFHAVTPDGETLEMGAERPFVPGTRLVVVPPAAPGGDAIEVALKRVTAEGVEIVAESAGDRLEHEASAAGVYRVEVRVTPEHFRPELGDFADRLITKLIWIYSNPIYLR